LDKICGVEARLVGVSGPEIWKSGKEPAFLNVGPDFCDSGQLEIF
jgi:hypothetical protein